MRVKRPILGVDGSANIAMLGRVDVRLNRSAAASKCNHNTRYSEMANGNS
jgi:hypothetical protein